MIRVLLSYIAHVTYLAAPNGFDRVVVDGLGEDRGEGTAEPTVDLGSNSSFRRVS